MSPLRDFLAAETTGAVLLAACAGVALVWANSPWSGSYEGVWSTHAVIGIAEHQLDLDLRHWINDGLMTIFFFVVGLEIKRELTDGHLSTRRAALLPAVAALGGMIMPAVIYLAIAGSSTPRGWAIPMATDIALAVGVLAIVGTRIPASLRIFLLGLAIVDDIGAIVIIAVIYSTGVCFGWLAAATVGVIVTFLLGRTGTQTTLVYVPIGAFVWFGLHEAGIHPTIAGVVMGLLAPATPRFPADLVSSSEPTNFTDVEAAHAASRLARESVSVVEWLQHVLHPWTSFVIVPVFALANTGIPLSLTSIRHAAGSAVTWGVIAGLLIGKPLGITLATRGIIRARLADNPENATHRHIVGIGTTAGIGFTVALFITELALTEPAAQTNAKLAILFASIAAAIMSTVILTRDPPPTRDP